VAADVEAQTEQCLKNVRAILEAAGSDLSCVLRCGVFLQDMREFDRMNAAYARMFGDHRPARTTIAAAALPGEGLRVEIDAMPIARPAPDALRRSSKIANHRRTRFQRHHSARSHDSPRVRRRSAALQEPRGHSRGKRDVVHRRRGAGDAPGTCHGVHIPSPVEAPLSE
jgi:hypothetical protein